MPIGGKTLGPISTGSLEETGEIYNVGEWHRHDVRALGRRKLLQTGIVADQDFISPDAMQRHALWRGFLEPAGLRWYCGVLVRAGDDLWNLALERTPEQGAFLLEEQEALSKLRAPFSRSATLSRRLEGIQLEGIGAALDRAGQACCLLDSRGLVLQINERADAFLREDLVIHRRKLLAVNRPDLTSKIDTHVTAVLRSRASSQAPELLPISVPRAGRRPLVVEAHPLRGSASDLFGLARIMIFISQPSVPESPNLAKLQSIFGLTTAEARVAGGLTRGSTLLEVCNRVGIGHETGRSHLKSIFQKIGVSSQIELVALLASIVGS